MSYVTVMTTLTARFGALFWLDYPLAPVYFDDNPLVDSAGALATKPTPDPDAPTTTFYVRQTLIPSASMNISLGGTAWTPYLAGHRFWIVASPFASVNTTPLPISTTLPLAS